MNCVVCESNLTEHYHTFTHWKETPFSVYRCSTCKSLFQSPMPHNPNSLYNEAYYTGKQEYSYHDERKQYQYSQFVWNARLQTIKKYVTEGRLLDVGCSFGGFVQTASHKGFLSVGLDVSSYAIDQGNYWARLNHKNRAFLGLFQGDLLNIPQHFVFLPNSFNVITMIEVAEHLSDPIANFKNAFTLLDNNGVLIIQTANFEGWQFKDAGVHYHYFMPGHLVYYTATALKEMLQKIGFTSFKEFFPTDFSVLAKLRKSRGGFKKIADYKKWIHIIYYHYRSKLKKEGHPLTSSYVLYAFKKK